MVGHTKPLCILLAKLVRMRPLYATLFTSTLMLEKVNEEFARRLPQADDTDDTLNLRKHIR